MGYDSLQTLRVEVFTSLTTIINCWDLISYRLILYKDLQLICCPQLSCYILDRAQYQYTQPPATIEFMKSLVIDSKHILEE
jgi:hypothetical protein